MTDQLDELVESLLYEGYALYPYTPSATKNATPTPFGIVYPPAYAKGSAATFDHLRVDCVLESGGDAALSGSVRFLQAAGDRHEGAERRLEIPPTPVATLIDDGAGKSFAFEGEQPVSGRARLRAEQLEGDLVRVRMCVHNTTEVEGAEDMARGDALKASLISTHVVVKASAGRFASPLEREGPAGAAAARCESVNSFPVLASSDDRAILGAAIVLPDHPQLSPESRVNLFDNTEIEEALLLHVKTLSDSERDEIAQQDPAVREMIARADGVSNEDLMAMHGLMRPSSEVPGWSPAGGPLDLGPPPEPGHPNPGEETMEVARGTIRKGGKVILHPGESSRDPLDGMLKGRVATIERIYYDMDDKVHVGVTVDGDASQELYRETGRYIFFKGDEVEPYEGDPEEARG